MIIDIINTIWLYLCLIPICCLGLLMIIRAFSKPSLNKKDKQHFNPNKGLDEIKYWPGFSPKDKRFNYFERNESDTGWKDTGKEYHTQPKADRK